MLGSHGTPIAAIVQREIDEAEKDELEIAHGVSERRNRESLERFLRANCNETGELCESWLGTGEMIPKSLRAVESILKVEFTQKVTLAAGSRIRSLEPEMATTISTPSADAWKALAVQIRLNATWCAVGPAWIGLELGAAMWRRRSPFYPFDLIAWGFITALWLWRALVGPNQLSSTVPLAVANERKKEARSLVPYILGTALTSFTFGLCSVAGKQFRGLCIVAAFALGALLILMIWTTERKIKRVARGFYRPAGEPAT